MTDRMLRSLRIVTACGVLLALTLAGGRPIGADDATPSDAYAAGWERYFVEVGSMAAMADSLPDGWQIQPPEVRLDVEEGTGQLVTMGEYAVDMDDDVQGGALLIVHWAEETAEAEFDDWLDGMQGLEWELVEGPGTGDESACVRVENDDTVSAQCMVRDGARLILGWAELPGDAVEGASNSATRLALVFQEAAATIDQP